jgi:hypothetical protein
MQNTHDIKSILFKFYLHLTCSVKLNIQNTKFKIINQHRNDMCHVQSLENDFYHGTVCSFCYVFTLSYTYLLTFFNLSRFI